MTNKKAIEILKKFLEYKEQAVRVWSEDKFQSDLESIRVANENFARYDKAILETILRELTEKNDSNEKASKKIEDTISLDPIIKKEIARQVRLYLNKSAKNEPKRKKKSK